MRKNKFELSPEEKKKLQKKSFTFFKKNGMRNWVSLVLRQY